MSQESAELEFVEEWLQKVEAFWKP